MQPVQPGLNSLLPKELLLISQAVCAQGTAIDPAASATLTAASPSPFEAVSRMVLSHPAVAHRPSTLFTPEACLQHYQDMLRFGGLDNPHLDVEAKTLKGRTHMKLARKYFAEYLSEVRDRLGNEEVRMRTLLKEIEEIQNGVWDQQLTRPYILVQPSQDPLYARYAHHQSGALQSIPPEGNSETGRQPSAIAQAPVEAKKPEAPSEQVQGAPPTDLEIQGGAGIESAGVQQTDVAEASEDEASGNRQGSPKKGARMGSTKQSKASIPERRSSTRASRASINNMGDILPPPTETVDSDQLSDAASDTPREPSPKSAALERDSSQDSTFKKQNKGSHRPNVSRDATKRKRNSTPQGSNIREASPAQSDDAKSRSKRVKTEEPESSLGTPADLDRSGLNQPDASSARRFRNAAPHLIQRMQGSVHSTYFKEPVRKGEAANYFEIIKNPMDLKTLSQNVKAGKVASSTEFTRDLALIFANAVMYNGQSNHVGQDAVAMWREAQELLRVLEAAEQRLA